MIIFLYGTDVFRIHERITILKKAFQKKFDPRGYNIKIIDAQVFAPETFSQYTQSMGLFSSKRFIVLSLVEQCSKAQQEAIAEILHKIPEETICCVTAGVEKIPHTPLFQLLTCAQTVEAYPVLNPIQVKIRITQELKKNGITHDRAVIDVLAQICGSDLFQLKGLIHQLAQSPKPVTASDVQRLAPLPVDENNFHFLDAVSQKNSQRALTLLEAQYQSGNSDFGIIALLGRQIGTLLKIKNNTIEGLHPYVIKKATQQAKAFDTKQLRSLLWNLLLIEQRAKLEKTNARALLTLFVAALCAENKK